MPTKDYKKPSNSSKKVEIGEKRRDFSIDIDNSSVNEFDSIVDSGSNSNSSSNSNDDSKSK